MSTLPAQEQYTLFLAVATQSLQYWGLEGSSLSLIKYRENAVYKVTDSQGNQFALRLHRPGYHSMAALKSELSWMSALDESGIAVPKIIPCTDGKLFHIHKGEGIPLVAVDLFAWIDGTPLGSVEEGLGNNAHEISTLYKSLGETAARLHDQSSEWVLPAHFERHAWDHDGLVGESPFWGRFWELELLTDSQKKLLEQARLQISKDLKTLDHSPHRYSLIHADFVPENLMKDQNQLRLIDFDDAGFGWHLFELATALYFIQEEACYEIAKDALIDGYVSIRPCIKQDLHLLDTFLTARGCTYLGWIRSRQETDTARDLAPDLIRRACDQANQYLDQSK